MSILLIVVMLVAVFFIKIDKDSELMMSSKKRYEIQSSLTNNIKMNKSVSKI